MRAVEGRFLRADTGLRLRRTGWGGMENILGQGRKQPGMAEERVEEAGRTAGASSLGPRGQWRTSHFSLKRTESRLVPHRNLVGL